MNPEKIGKFICELRKEKNLSQYQLADMIPITRQGVSKWERGVTTPDPQTLLRLSELFNVSINELLTGERLETNSIEDLEKTTLSILDQSNKKTILIKRIITISISTIVILLLAFLSYYFINSYNTTKVYTIYGKSENFTTTDGLMIITKEKMYLKLGKLKNKNNNEIKNLKLYSINDNMKNIMVEDTDIDNIVIKDNMGYYEKIMENTTHNIIKNMYLEITYNEEETETIKLDFVKDFSNINLFFSKEKKGETKKLTQNVTQVEIKKEEIVEEIKPVIEDKPKEDNQINTKIVEEESKEPVVEEQKEEPITPDMIINKIKETCILDAGSYICGYDNYSIMLMYYEETNKITLYKNFNILGDYLLNENNYACIVEECQNEFETIIKDQLLP